MPIELLPIAKPPEPFPIQPDTSVQPDVADAATTAAITPVIGSGQMAGASFDGADTNGSLTGIDPDVAASHAEARVAEAKAKEGCTSCKERRYQDGSNDPGVSFQTPQNIDPNVAASVVMGHEMEHVMHEQAKAKQEGAEVISQSVVLHSAICPECGRSYVAGGQTRTVTRHGGGNVGFDAGAKQAVSGSFDGSA